MSRGHRFSIAPLALTALVFLSACAAKRVVLAPAPTATIASAVKFQGALGRADGVRIIAAANEWNGKPADLGKRVTPIRVRIENHSGHPLRIAYDDFDLKAQNGNTFAALPPTKISGTQYVGDNIQPRHSAAFVNAAFYPADDDEDEGARVVITPDFDWDGFYTAPYWGFGYNGLSPWPYAWAPDYGYYGMYYPYMKRIKLPTRSMLRKAIPEGVIENNGFVSGFLYFQKPDVGREQLEFTAKLVDARTGQQFGTIQIPFIVQKS
jgi:hypothetical protein